MTVSFRNVDASAGDPVESWPQEALLAALERGSLVQWRRIVGSIDRDPWGSVARTVEEILTYSRPYGVDVVMERAIAGARDRAQARERAVVAGRIRDLLHESGRSTEDFARSVGTSRSRLSTYLSGKVTPAATMLVRMENVVNRSD